MSKQSERANLLVVLGATGHQGGSILQYFASQPDHLGYRLRGVTRDVNSKSSRSLEALGIEMVQADLFDVESLKRAFDGATHVFATTDSNQYIFEAISHPEKLSPGQSVVEYGAAIELGLGRNVVDAITASASTIQRVVWSTLPGPTKLSGGKYTKVAMFDVKESIAEMFRSQPELSGKLSLLIIGFYAENAARVPSLWGPQKQTDGVYQLSLPMSDDVPVPIADVEADSGAWVAALFKAPAGVTLMGASEYLTWSGWLEIWGKHVGVATRYHKDAPDESPSESGSFKEAFTQMGKFVDEFGYDGGSDEFTSPEKLRQTGIDVQTSSITNQIHRHDWSHLL